MDLYSSVSFDISKLLTTRYSSSFSVASLLLPRSTRAHIYAIYGMVRIADEIVDTYTGDDKGIQLDALEAEVYSSMTREYSANPIVHSFARTATQFQIGKELIAPFFESMRVDTDPPTRFSEEEYRRYIRGSAEVVGLMCLRVFTAGDQVTYESLEYGASRLGAAYQKINFLRDMADDYRRLSRVYFPCVSYDSFDDTAKRIVEEDIERDLEVALQAIKELPKQSRRAVLASYNVYHELYDRLKNSSATTIKEERLRVPTIQKIFLIASTVARTAL